MSTAQHAQYKRNVGGKEPTTERVTTYLTKLDSETLNVAAAQRGVKLSELTREILAFNAMTMRKPVV